MHRHYSHELAPTGLGKITYLQQFFTWIQFSRLSPCLWVCTHYVAHPYTYGFLCLAVSLAGEVLGRVSSGGAYLPITAPLPHFCELESDTAVRFFGSYFVRKAFNGTICDHWCIKCLAWADSKLGTNPLLFIPYKETPFRFNTYKAKMLRLSSTPPTVPEFTEPSLNTTIKRKLHSPHFQESE